MFTCVSACLCRGTLHVCKCTCVNEGKSSLVGHFLPYILKQGLSLEPEPAHLASQASLLILCILCLCPLGWNYKWTITHIWHLHGC